MSTTCYEFKSPKERSTKRPWNPHDKDFCFYRRKRNLEQGNIFTSDRDRDPPGERRFWRETPWIEIPTLMVKSGWYASYWNAFLFLNVTSTNLLHVLKSSADLFCSIILLLMSQSIRDQGHTRTDGILGGLERSVWNGGLFLWPGMVTSTWNLVCLTVER